MAANTAKKKTTPTKGSAASQKSSASGSRTAKSARSEAKRVSPTPVQEPERADANPMIMREAALWLVLAVCILIFISYLGIGGYVGNVVSDISFGIFGITAYLFPFLLFIAAAFLISNRGSRVAGVKFFSSLGLFVCICSFATLFTKDYQDIRDIAEIYEHSASYKNGGGVIGGMICGLFRPAFGAIGTGIVLLILTIICLVLITQKSLMRSVKRQGSKVVRSAKESNARRREEYRRERERRDAWDLPQEMLDASEGIEGSDGLPQAQRTSGQSLNVGTSGQMMPGMHSLPGQTILGAQPWQRQISQGQDVLPGRDRKRKGKRGEQPANYAQQASMYQQGAYPQNGAVGPQGSVYPQSRSMNQQETSSHSQRTRIDVPVLFPVNSREHHKVSGVTTDTKIQGDPFRVGMEVHEITPKRGTDRGRSARSTASANTTGRNSYIELGESSAQKKQPQNTSGLELYHDTTDVSRIHIEGIQTETDAKKSDSPDNSDSASAKTVLRGTTVLEDNMKERKKPADREALPSAAVSDETDGQEEAQQPAVEQEHASSKRNPRSSQKEIEEGIASVEAEMAKTAEAVRPEYIYPPIDLLKKGKGGKGGNQEQEIRSTAAKLQQTLDSFGVHATVTNVSCGPSVTRYELLPEQGVKVSRIVGLSDDIKLNLAAADIRIEAPIPGKSAVGIEVPNSENSAVSLRDLLESDEFKNHPSKLAFATGKDIGGKVVVSDIAKMPHLLIAGATGSGKSVCINTIIISLLYKASPEEVKLIMIDPKVVELSVYNGIPHLFIPVVTDPKKAAGALNWGVAEMMSRYDKFAEVGVRDLKGYNQKIEALKDIEDENKPQKLPQIVIIVDELADLMMVAPGEVEDSICRLAQLARAAGIHLIIATQRPSVNVITGLIKANMPSRIAFSVSSGVDSRTIIDMNGAEKLLGKGDMLFYPQGYQKPARVQGAFVSDEEVADVVDFLKNENTAVSYDAQMEEQIAKVQQAVSAAKGNEDTDALFADAGKFIIDKDKASIGMLQRVFKIGFNRAARIMDQLSDAGVVGPEEGTKPRKILMSAEEFENYLEQN